VRDKGKGDEFAGSFLVLNILFLCKYVCLLSKFLQILTKGLWNMNYDTNGGME